MTITVLGCHWLLLTTISGKIRVQQNLIDTHAMTELPPNPGELLREVARLYTRAQRAAAECCGTTNTQCHILTELGRSGPIPLSELGARLLLEKSWISRAVESLVRDGFATKEPNPADARSWLVTLTAAGQQRVTALNATLNGHADGLLTPLGKREREDVARSLQRLRDLLLNDSRPACSPSRTDTKGSSCQ